MPRYLVAIHHPDAYDPAAMEDAAMTQAIDALNREMVAVGVRVLALGLHPAKHAKSLRADADGRVVITHGPYLPTDEHMGGFWILDVESIEDALAWGRKAAVACRAPVEVRQFHG